MARDRRQAKIAKNRRARVIRAAARLDAQGVYPSIDRMVALGAGTYKPVLKVVNRLKAEGRWGHETLRAPGGLSEWQANKLVELRGRGLSWKGVTLEFEILTGRKVSVGTARHHVKNPIARPSEREPACEEELMAAIAASRTGARP